jgi:L-seryl-tRNA(Ser) seleniumtransferase
MPEIMEHAGTKLREVGTTNRTHEFDYANALGPTVGLILKIHPSNYRVEGFSSSVSARVLARLAKEAALPFMHDLGSGTLIELDRFGLPGEVTVKQAVQDGADLVTFSGDKLLGGPQAGIIVGRKDLISALRKSPMKRALRLDKIRIAALEATLKLYRHCERLESQLPTIRQLSRPIAEIFALAERISEALRNLLENDYSVEVVACSGEIGSGAAPVHKIASAAIRIAPASSKKSMDKLGAQLRSLPVPVLGRMSNNALFLDVRCLEDEAAFLNNLQRITKSSAL